MREMLARVDAHELAEWEAVYSLNPWGEDRADLRSGVVAATLQNVYRRKGAGSKRPEDFLLFGDRPKLETPEQQQAYLAALAGGKKRK